MVKKISEKEIFKTKFFTIKDIELETPAKSVTYQIIEKRNTALIVPITDDGKFILVREYFPAISEYGLSFPKGGIDEGKDAIFTANKELQEEIGKKASSIEEIGILTMSPGYSTQKTHIFLAKDLTESKLEGDEIEELEVVILTSEEIENLIQKGEINEARTIAAFYLAQKYV